MLEGNIAVALAVRQDDPTPPHMLGSDEREILAELRSTNERVLRVVQEIRDEPCRAFKPSEPKDLLEPDKRQAGSLARLNDAALVIVEEFAPVFGRWMACGAAALILASVASLLDRLGVVEWPNLVDLVKALRLYSTR